MIHRCEIAPGERMAAPGAAKDQWVKTNDRRLGVE
jgi:hypothetical protein